MDRFRRGPERTVRVPEGHKVVTVGPSPEPCVARTESGALIADFGPHLASAAVFNAVEQRLREQPQAMVVWFVGPGALPLLMRDVPILVGWLRRLHIVRSVRGPEVRGDVFVIPAGGGPEAAALMSLLWALDLSVHESAPDGVGFVEVHRPDGSITVGMTGPAFTGDDALRGALRDSFEQLLAAEWTTGGDEDARLIRESMVTLILYQRWRAGIRPAVMPPTPLSDLLSRAVQDSSGAMREFTRAFLDAQVGVPTVGVSADADGVFHSTPERPISLQAGATPDGRPVLLACADREVFAERFDPAYNVELRGRDLARMALGDPTCEGILINSAASEHAIVLDRAQLAALLPGT